MMYEVKEVCIKGQQRTPVGKRWRKLAYRFEHALTSGTSMQADPGDVKLHGDQTRQKLKFVATCLLFWSKPYKTQF